MSGFVAMWNLDGRPADRPLIERMTATIAHRGPDGDGYWIDRSVAFGHRMLHTTPESLDERQPLPDETGALCLVFDGRLDNREELAAALAAKGVPLRKSTDAELVLGAYQCWGQDCARRLLGDFAFAIWNGKTRELFGARDPLATKPFYYYMDHSVFLCASDLLPILAHPAVRRRCNEGMLGEYLACEITSQEETLYQDIFRLPPAHTLVVSQGRLRKRRFWEADPSKTMSYGTDRDYADHFLEIFAEAVRCRLRSHLPVGAYLSGGLDSSSVAAMAQSLCRDGGAPGHGLETFALIFPGLPCDESPFIDDVARHCGFPVNRIPPEIHGAAYFTEAARQDRDFPGYPNGTMGNPLRALARGKDIRVILTGGGGDEWLTGSLYHAADLLRGLKILPMLHRIGPDAGNATPREILRAAVDYGLRPLLPRTLRQALKRMVKRGGVPSWINPHFARRINLADRLAAAPDTGRCRSAAQADLWGTLPSGWWPHSFEIEERAASRLGIEERHPFCDRRLVEFALALPETQRWRGAETKFILRQAIQGLLPESVRRRTDKAEFSPVFSRAFEAAGGPHLFQAPVSESMGWVNGSILRKMCREQERGAAHVWPLWMVAGIEFWMAAVWAGPEAQSRPALCPGGMESAGFALNAGA